METAGYAMIKPGAPGVTAVELRAFYGYPVRVLEFAADGGVLVLDKGATGIASFDARNVLRSFRCEVHGGVICPPGLDILGRMAYVTRALSRKGGYCSNVRAIVITASLSSGHFDDRVLWSIQ